MANGRTSRTSSRSSAEMHTVALDEIPSKEVLAFFIGEPSRGQRHIGLAYRPRQGSPLRFLHLAWHKDLRDDEVVDPKYRGVLLRAVPAVAHVAVVAQCRRAARADLDPQHIQYGLGYLQATIRRDLGTDVMVIENASGLTCATYVLALFDLASLELLDVGTWEDREGDAEWKANVVEHLSAQPAADSKRIAQLQNDKALVRIRPEDVAAAATASRAPVGFADATPAGEAILCELHALAARG